MHFGSHPNRRLRILIKILTLRLCSYINLFSCQISSYGLLPSLRRLSGYGLITASGITLAVFIQLKMVLNNCCSPDLLNVRRQPFSGWRPTSSSAFIQELRSKLLRPRDQLAIRRSPSLTLFLSSILRSGGADRDRTGDLLLAKQALSQLSYSPFDVVGLVRIELTTSPLSGVRSSQLSYRPESQPLALGL